MATEQQSARYVYEPLGVRPNATRILRLDAASTYEDPLYGEIFHATVLDRGKARLFADYTVQYDALSYAWGAPHFTEVLHCANETVLPITETLYQALKRLRDARVFYLWVDAISINQADLVERSAQVKIMGNIFEEARCVHVWLGEENTGTLGAEALDHLCEDIGLCKTPQCRRQLAENLLQQPFWSRRWTIQEVMLARDLKFHWGTNACRGIQFIPFLYNMAPKSTDEQKDTLRFIEWLWRSNGLRPGIMLLPGGLGDDTPMKMFLTFTRHKCTDEMDIVYSLLGLLERSKPPASSSSFVRLLSSVDYKVSVREAFIALARYHLSFDAQANQCVSILLECALRTRHLDKCQFGPSQNTDRNVWPSWLPDWRDGSVYDPNVRGDKFVTWPVEEPAGDASKGGWGLSAIDDASKCLSIVVLRGEEIVHVTKSSTTSNLEDVEHQKHHSFSQVSFATDTGYWGTGHPSIQPGDFIAYVHHLKCDFVPFVFRRIMHGEARSNLDQVVLVGDCAIFGVVQGDDTKFAEGLDQQLQKLFDASKISAPSDSLYWSFHEMSRLGPRPKIARAPSKLQVF